MGSRRATVRGDARAARGGAAGTKLAYQPALDGLRGIAVLAVLLYHAGVSWAGGGFLGVEVFFVLSGYLITSLLLAEWQRSEGIALRDFWARRARRLLPALFAVVVVCAIYEAVVGPTRAAPDFGADGLATLLYIGNWHQIWVGSGYFAQAAVVSPLQHTWSLAIEEQFYVVWPLVVLAVLSTARRGVTWLLGVSCVGAVLSAAEMAWLYHGGAGVNRVYYGTDTRAQSLLVGAALACVLVLRRSVVERDAAGAHSPSGSSAGPALSRLGLPAAGAAAVGVVVVGVMLARATGSSDWLYHGGFLGLDVGVALLIVGSLFQPAVRSVLGAWPLRGLGLISYGLYLWHFPLFLWLTESSTGLGGGALLTLRLGAALAVSVLSYVLIEQPIRQRRLPVVARLRVWAPIGVAASLIAVSVAWTTGEAGAAGPELQGLGGPGRCSVSFPGTTSREEMSLCPPVRVLVVGDSIGLTLGVQLYLDQGRYGVATDDVARLGCSFSERGESAVDGVDFGSPPAYCLNDDSAWRSAEQAFHAQAVVVEMGYWDELDWRWGGTPEHLGDPEYDAAVRAGAERLVRTLASAHVPVVFLSVPLVDPAPEPNGSPAPQSSAARNGAINSILRSVAAGSAGTARFFDISPYVTPSGRYQADVDGGVCRSSDGVHFAGAQYLRYAPTYCGQHLQAVLLPWLRRLVLTGSPGTPSSG